MSNKFESRDLAKAKEVILGLLADAQQSSPSQLDLVREEARRWKEKCQLAEAKLKVIQDALRH